MGESSADTLLSQMLLLLTTGLPSSELTETEFFPVNQSHSDPVQFQVALVFAFSEEIVKI